MANSIYTYGQTPGSGGGGGTTGDTIKLGGQPIALGTGNVTAGTQRITIATNDAAIATLAAYLAHIDTVLDTMEISMDTVDNWNQNNRCKGSPVVGQDGVAAASGVITANTQRVTVATNDGIVTSLSNLDAWNDADRCKINMYLNDGVMVDIGTGLIDFGTQRVTIASDDQVVTCLTDLASATAQANSGSTPTSPIIRVQPVDAAGNIITGGSSSVVADVTKLGGNAIDLNAGAAGAGTQRIVLANDKYIAISKDTNVNATGNRIFVASNVDQLNGNAIDLNSGAAGAGTQRIVLANDKYIAISKDTNVNATGNRIFVASNVDQLNGNAIDLNSGAAGAGTQRIVLANDKYIAISKDTNVNATGNRIYVASNVDQLNGSTISIGSGAAGATGTQRIISATDDPGVVSLAILDNFIGTNGSAVPAGQAVAQIGGSDGTYLRTVKVGSDGAIYVEQNSDPAGHDSVNDWVNTRTKARFNDKPSAQVSSSTVAETTALSWTDTLGFSFMEVWVDVSGANALTNVYVYASPDGTDANQQDITAFQNTLEALSQTTPSGSCRLVMVFTKCPAYVKVTTKSAGTSTVNCYYRYRV